MPEHAVAYLIIRHKVTGEIPTVAIVAERWKELRKGEWKDYEVVCYQDGSKYTGPGAVDGEVDDEELPAMASNSPELAPGQTMSDVVKEARRLEREAEKAAKDGAKPDARVEARARSTPSQQNAPSEDDDDLDDVGPEGDTDEARAERATHRAKRKADRERPGPNNPAPPTPEPVV